MDCIQEYLDHVRNTVKELDGTLFIEQEVEFSDWVPDGYDTADAIILGGTVIDIQDLKTGKGLQVFAKDNPQPILYGLGVLQEFEFLGLTDNIKTVRLTIVQPLLDHIDVAEYTIEELHAKGAELNADALRAMLPDAPRVAGEKQCHFCKASGNCKVEADYHLQTACGELAQWEQGSSLTLEDPQDMDDELTRIVLDNRTAFTKWFDKVKDRTAARIMDGGNLPGYKMVAGSSSRSWTDETKAENALKRELGAADAFTKKLLTPPTAEKVIGKTHNIMKNHVTKAAGAPTLVKDTDKREAIYFSEPNPEDDFAAVT